MSGLQRDCSGCINGHHALHRKLRRSKDVVFVDEVIVVAGYGAKQRGMYLWLGNGGRCIAIVNGPVVAMEMADAIVDAHERKRARR